MTDTIHTIVPEPPAPDPRVAGLAFLGRHFGRPAAADAIVRTLPLEDGRLPSIFVPEAAERMGLVAAPATFELESVTPLMLPLLADTTEGAAWALLERRDDRFLVWMGGADEARWAYADDLGKALTGEGWFVQAKLYFDARSVLYEVRPDRHWFWGPLLDNWWIYAAAAFASLAINVLSTFSAFYVMAVYDRVIPNNAIDTLWVLTGGVTILYLGDLAVKVIRGYLVDVAARRFDLAVGSRVFAKALSLGAKGRPQSSGTLANTIREFEGLREFFTSMTLTVLGDLPFLLVFMMVIAVFAGPVAWVPFVGIPLILGVAALSLVPQRRLTDRSYKESAQRSALLYEIVSGLETVKTQGATGWARRNWDQLLVQNAGTQLESRLWTNVTTQTTLAIQALVGVGVIVLCALLVAEAKLSTGAMMACSILAGRALQPLTMLSALIGRLHGTRASLSALDNLMKAPSEDAVDRPLLHMPKLRGELQFREASFAYPAAPMTTPVPAVSEVSFVVRPGEQIALLGRVGSGKSTLLGLILKLHEVTGGHVVVDGLDVRQLASADLRAQIGYVPQDPYMFHGTIRENLLMGNPGASEEQLLNAVRVAGLDELLAGTADGLNTQVGEGGRKLSGGTRQCVAIARALVGEPPILLMDEPTSQMDTTTESKVLQRLAQARRGKTTLVVTHRTSVLAIVQRVLVMDGGRLVSDGPKEQVLKGAIRPSA